MRPSFSPLCTSSLCRCAGMPYSCSATTSLRTISSLSCGLTAIFPIPCEKSSRRGGPTLFMFKVFIKTLKCNKESCAFFLRKTSSQWVPVLLRPLGSLPDSIKRLLRQFLDRRGDHATVFLLPLRRESGRFVNRKQRVTDAVEERWRLGRNGLMKETAVFESVQFQDALMGFN